MPTLLVSLVLILAVVLAVRSLKRSGGCSCSGCSGGCAGCHGACHCHTQPDPASPEEAPFSAPKRASASYRSLELPEDPALR